MNENNQKSLFTFPWGFKESFTISFVVLLTGLLIEFFSSGAYFGLPSFPRNIVLFAVFFLFVLILHFYLNFSVIKWFSSIPASISAITVYTLQILIMGFIPQESGNVNSIIYKLGLTHITQSMQFIYSSFFLLVILTFTILKRIRPITKRNFGFFLNHFGLFLIIVTGLFGSSDKKTLTLNLREGDTLGVAFDKKYQLHKLPFKIELLDFIMETYNPEMMVLDKKENFISDKNGKNFFTVDKLLTHKINNYNISVSKYLESCKPEKSDYTPLDTIGSTSAAYIDVFDLSNNKTVSGWISCGSILFPPQAFVVDSNFIIIMNEPRPKRFLSKVNIHFENGTSESKVIEVNHPLKIKGWHIYQTGYDSKMGKWSAISIFELISDPWLNVIYLGIIMLIAGGCFLIWFDKFI